MVLLLTEIQLVPPTATAFPMPPTLQAAPILVLQAQELGLALLV
jgi:hypothetical protein